MIKKLLETKTETKQYDCFISHASEDKNDFVEALADKLEEKGIKVWYDAHVMNIGDSLRESIDNGLKESLCGIVVLSKNFFAKHWTDYELNGLVARQNSNGQKIILPIWHNITIEEVREYSPSLSDIVAGNSSSGIETITINIIKAINRLKEKNKTNDTIDNEIGKLSSEMIETFEKNNLDEYTNEQAKNQIEELITDDKNIVKIHKFINYQTNKLINLLSEDFTNIAHAIPEHKLFYERVLVYDNYCELLLSSIITGAYWGNNKFTNEWINSLKRLTNLKIMEQGYTSLIKFQHYPSLLMYYALLLVGLIKEDFDLIHKVFYGFDINELNENEPIQTLYPQNIVSKDSFNSILQKRYYTPVNDHIHDVLRPLFIDIIPDDKEYSLWFDRVEYLISLEFALTRLESHYGIWFPIGRFVWRYDFNKTNTEFISKLHPFFYFNKLIDKGDIFKSNLLGSNLQKYAELIEQFTEKLDRIDLF